MPPSLRTLLLAPVHVAALVTGAKSFRDSPILGSAALNRRGLHVARMKLAAEMAGLRRRQLTQRISVEDRTAFERDGFVVRPNFLPTPLFEALKAEALGHVGAARHMPQGDAVTRRIALDRAALARAPALRALFENPEWRGLLAYIGATGAEPLYYLQTIFAGARQAAPDPQTRLHADTFHATMKAWYFLKDVGPEDGPLVYVPGSHRLTPRRLAWERRYSIEAAGAQDLSARGSPRIELEAARRLGWPEPRRFAVPANTLVVADTMGFHARAQSVGPSHRIEIWAYSRHNPFLPWPGARLADLPGIRGNGASLYWQATDLAERLGLARNPWRKAGLCRPDTPLCEER